jgi:hypothetical protein
MVEYEIAVVLIKAHYMNLVCINKHLLFSMHLFTSVKLPF